MLGVVYLGNRSVLFLFPCVQRCRRPVFGDIPLVGLCVQFANESNSITIDGIFYVQCFLFVFE